MAETEDYTKPFYVGFGKHFKGVNDFGQLPPLEYPADPVGGIKVLTDRISELETDNASFRKLLLSLVNNKDICNLLTRMSLSSNASIKNTNITRARAREKELEPAEAQLLIQKLVEK